MAGVAASVLRASVGSGASAIVLPGSGRSSWHTIHTDLTAAAESASILLRPLTFANTTNVRIIEVPEGVTRFFARGQYPQASTLTTNPVVRFYGIDGPDLATTNTLLDDGSYQWLRLDNADSGSAGLTISLDTTNDGRDTTYKYTDCVPDLTGIDLQGCRWLLALGSTAAVISAGALALQVRFKN